MLNLADLRSDAAASTTPELTGAQKRAYTFLHLASHPDWTPADVLAFAQVDAPAFVAVFDLFIAGQLPKDGAAGG